MNRWVTAVVIAAIIIMAWVCYVTLAGAGTTLGWTGAIVLGLIVIGIVQSDRPKAHGT
jgi:hypothetical protein